jgi:hypothetical protein
VWHNVIKTSLLNQGFTPCPSDPCLYLKKSASNLVIIALFVDDLLICSDSVQDRTSAKATLLSEFKMTDEGDVQHFLQLEISRNRTARTVTVSQRQYVEELLEKYAEFITFSAGIPMKTGYHLPSEGPAPGSAEQKVMEIIPYRQVVGQLVYLSRTTRLDIAQAVGVVCRFLHNPGPEHWKAVQKILAYLKGTSAQPLVLGGFSSSSSGSPEMTAYCDANWESDRSVSGFLILLGESPITWASKRQSIPATSSTYAEWISLYHTSTEMVWLTNVMNFLRQELPVPPTVFSDSEGALSNAQDLKVTPRNKHWEPKYQFIQSLKENGVLKFAFIPGSQNPADHLTKAVSKSKLISSLARSNRVNVFT